MDFNLKQWRDEQQQKQQHESEENQEQTQTPSAKLPRFLTLDPFLNSPPPAASASASASAPAPAPLPLFLTEPTTTTKNDMSPSPSDSSPTKLPRYGSYFSITQWQELELQALIFRHMLAGATIPPQLLHLIHKSINPYYFSHSLHQHFSHFHPSLMQSSGYWGKGGMGPEPTRCRRTDGKKWRCSKDVVAGHKYCERHVHRGRSRSRKPVEIPTPPPTSSGVVGGGLLKVTAPSIAAHHPIAHVGASPSFDIRHLNNRSSTYETQDALSVVGNSSSSQTLRQFFDDWSRPHQESENTVSSAGSNATTSSLSVSDFSLKLSTGGDGNASGSMQQDRSQPNPDGSTWASHQMAPMGGPLAEALRSSTSNSSPTSVLHH